MADLLCYARVIDTGVRHGGNGMKSFTLSILAVAAGIAAGAPAHAADNIMKVCGAKYQAAKSSNTLPAGQTWNQFLASCRGSMPKTATPSPTASAAAPAAPAAPAGRTVSAPGRPAGAASPVGRAQTAGLTAMHDRQRQCGAQWKADKAAGKVPAGQTWPKYWSACNARLKG
jgi:hypothetical protein